MLKIHHIFMLFKTDRRMQGGKIFFQSFIMLTLIVTGILFLLITTTRAQSKNHAPVANAGPDFHIDEETGSTPLDASKSYDVDGDTLMYAWQITDGKYCTLSDAQNVHATIIFQNRQKSYSCEYTVTVTDPLGAASTSLAIIDVNANNDGPSFTASILPSSIQTGETVILNVATIDPDSSSIILSAEDTNDTFQKHGIDITKLFTDHQNGTGTFTWTPQNEHVDVYDFIIVASDESSINRSQAEITVTAISTNPVFDNSDLSRTFSEDEFDEKFLYDITDYFNEPQLQNMEFSLGQPANGDLDFGWIELESDGSVRLHLRPDEYGQAQFTIIATDPDGNVGETTPIAITVNPVNDAPIITTVDQSAIDVVGKNTVTVRVTTTDVDGDALSYTWHAQNETTINNCILAYPHDEHSTTTIQTSDQTTSYQCTYIVTATDHSGATDSANVAVTVNVNTTTSTTPVVSPTPATPVVTTPFTVTTANVTLDEETQTTKLSVTPQGNGYTYLWTEINDNEGACSLSDMSSATPQLTVTNKTTNYSCVYEVLATNSNKESASAKTTVNVTANNDAPKLAIVGNQQGSEEQPLMFTVSATDSDSSWINLTVRDTYGDFEVKGINIATLFTDQWNREGIFQWTPFVGVTGTYRLTIIASDNSNIATQELMITISNRQVTTNETTIDTSCQRIARNMGSNLGKGMATSYDIEGNVIQSWEIFQEGGVHPLLFHVNGEQYIAVIKKRVGTSLHVYDCHGKLLKKKKLSQKLQWHNIIKGQLDQNKDSDELIIATLRKQTLRIDAVTFNTTKNKLTKIGHAKFRNIKNHHYQISVTQKKINVMINKRIMTKKLE